MPPRGLLTKGSRDVVVLMLFLRSIEAIVSP